MGMMSQGTDPTTSHGKYNGTVDVQGQPVQVQNGVVQVEGKPYFVSDNGAMVVDQQGKLLGHVSDGKFELVTPDYMNQMAQLGHIQ